MNQAEGKKSASSIREKLRPSKIIVPLICIALFMISLVFLNLGISSKIERLPPPFELLNGVTLEGDTVPTIYPNQECYEAGGDLDFYVEFNTSYNTDAWFSYAFFDADFELVGSSPVRYLMLIDERDGKISDPQFSIPEGLINGKNYVSYVSVSNSLANPFRYKIPFSICD